MNKNNIIKLVGCIILCQLAGIIGKIAMSPISLIWYKYLFKPDLTPPGWLISVIWIILYLLMGISLYLVINKETTRNKRHALIVFGSQLFLNALWTPVFFGLRSIIGGLIVIILLWISIFFTFYKFYKISKTSAYLLIPYILWVSYAVGLNLSIWILNS